METKKLKLGYFADGLWSHRAFEKLIHDETIEICFIVPRTDTTDNTLHRFSSEYNIDYLFPVEVNSKQFIETVKNYNCDIFVSMSFNQIFRSEIINIPRLKTINCHAGKLPFYRGRNILNWALINDETEFGITVHFVDKGIDTGDIILQYLYPIIDSDNYASLLDKAHNGCAEILYDAIKQLQNGTNQKLEQKKIHPVGFYCGKRVEGDEIINWNSDSRTLFNFIRSISAPGPKATTYFNGVAIKINKAELINDAPIYKNKQGQLLVKTDKGFYVKTRDSFIEISEIESSAKLKVGDTLGL